MEEKKEVKEVETVEDKTESMEPILDKKDSKTSKVIIAVIGSLLLVALLIVGLLLPKLLMTKKKIVEKEISTVFSEAKKNIKEADKNSLDFDLDEDSVGLSGEVKIKSNYKDKDIDLTKLDKYKIEFNGTLDKNNNKASMSLKLKDSKDIIDTKAFITGRDVYFNLGDIFNKVLSTKMDEEIKDMEVSNVDMDNIEKLLDKTEKALKDNIDDKDITKSLVERTINGKKKKYEEISYKVDVNEQTKNVLEAYKNDEDIIEILSDLTNKSEKETKEYLADEIDSLRNSQREEITVKTYIDGLFNKTKGIAVESDGEENIIIDIDGSKYNYKLMDNNKEIATGVYDKAKKEFTLSAEENGNEIEIEFNQKKKNNLVGNIKVKSSQIKVDADFNIASKIKGKKATNDVSLKANIEYDKEKFNFELDTTYTAEIGAKVEDFATKDSVDIDSITEQDTADIYSKLMEKVKPIIDEISPSLLAGA